MPTAGGLDSEVAIFSGIRFILFGFDSVAESQYRTELISRGGAEVGRYDKSCTHVIVSGIVLDHPVCVAARKDGKMLVTELWIEDSVDLGRLADANRVLYRPVKQLNGIPGSEALHICLTGYQRQERDDIMRMVELMGAHFSKPLIANKITHLICYKFEGEKYDLARRVNIKLVNQLWLEDCLKAWEILPTENYAKSGWEIEVLDAQAQDSEEETRGQSVQIPIQTSNVVDMTETTGSMHKGKASCDPEDVNYTKGMLSTPCRNYSYKNDLHVYGNIKDGRLAGFPDHNVVHAREGLMSMDPDKADNLCHANSPTMQLHKELNEESLSARKGRVSNAVERESLSLSYSRKTPSKPAADESLGNLFGSLHGNTCKDDPASVPKLSPPLSRPTNPDSLKCKATSVSPNLYCIDSKGYLLPQKRKVPFPGSVACSSDLSQNPNSPTCYPSATNSTLELKRNALTTSNEASSDNHIAVGNISLPGVGAGNTSSDLDSRESNSKPLTCSKISLKYGQHLLGTRSLNANASPLITSATGPSLVEETLEMDWTRSSTANLTGLAPKSSGTVPSDPASVIADDIVLRKSATTSHAERDLESLVLNDRRDGRISPLKQSNKDLKSKHDEPSDKLDIPIDVKNLQQKMVEKDSSPDSLKSDVTGLQIGTSPKMEKGENHEKLKRVAKKVFPKKKMCSRPRPNRSKCSEDESSLDKTIPGNRLPLISAEMEPKKVTSNNQNVVGESTIALKNNTSNGNQELLSKFHNKNAVVDKIDASKDGDKENKLVEMKTSITHQSTKGRLEKSKDGGRSNIGEKKVSEDNRKMVNIEMSIVTSSEPMHFILSGNRLQRKHFRMVITHLRGRICKDSHNWSYHATHFIVPEPVRRTEKFFAAAAAGRWILKIDYLSASTEAGKFLPEEPFEWYANAITEDANIDLKAPRKWRYLKEKTGHGAFYGFHVIIYGECIAPSLDTLKRVMKAGDGTILATSPPYTRFLKSDVDFAIVSSGFSRADLWIQEFLRHEIPCVTADYLVEYVCKPNHSLDRHVLFNTQEWAEKSLENLLIRSEEIISSDTMILEEDDGLKCTVCGSVDRGEVMLICGDEDGSLGCGIGTHIDCCDPPLEAVPEEDWFCQSCSKNINESSSDKKKNKSSKKSV